MPASRFPGTRRLVGVVAALALVVAGCGSGGGHGGSSAGATGASGAAARAPRPTDPAGVVRAWADALRHGHVAAATRYFAVPARVANGGPPLRLTTVDAIYSFNASLPCGAKVLATQPAPAGYLIVTFVLTTRPGGGGCRSASPLTARTAFRVRHGRITDWIRVSDLPQGQGKQA